MAYSYIKLDVLLNMKDTLLRSAVSDMHHDDDFVFSSANGLNFAVAFTAYDSEPEPILDESYGRLVFNSYEWGPKADGSYFTRREELQTHVCSHEELGLNEDRSNAKFMPLHEQGADFVSMYQKKLLCLKPEDMYIFGDYNSVNAR